MNYIIIITELGYESLFELRETESARAQRFRAIKSTFSCNFKVFDKTCAL